MTLIDPKKPLDVVAFGAAIVDVLAKVDDAFLEANGVPKAGMTLADSDRASAVYEKMHEPRMVSGGSAANTVAGLAVLGADVAFSGKVKDDTLGRVFADDIRTLGVQFETEPLPADDDGATARSMIMVTPDAQRSMLTDLGVSALLDETDVPTATVADSKIVYLEGYLWDREATKDTFRAAMKQAKSFNSAVALTLSDTFCVERHRADFLELVSGPVDVLFANEAEILSLYEIDDVREAVDRAAEAARVVVVTRSEKGCIAQMDGVRVEHPAEPIAQLVDTTGAGDLFAAGFLYGLTRGALLQTCARMGGVAASEIIQHVGARPERNLREVFARAGLV